MPLARIIIAGRGWPSVRRCSPWTPSAGSDPGDWRQTHTGFWPCVSVVRV